MEMLRMKIPSLAVREIVEWTISGAARDENFIRMEMMISSLKLVTVLAAPEVVRMTISGAARDGYSVKMTHIPIREAERNQQGILWVILWFYFQFYFFHQVFRLKGPMCITQADAEFVVAVIRKVLTEYTAKNS